MNVLITLNAASQVLQVKPYRIIHLCEEGCVVPAEDSHGQGTVRRFSKDDLFQLAICLELQNAGVTSARITKAMRIFNWLARAKSFAAVLREHGLCGVIGKLAILLSRVERLKLVRKCSVCAFAARRRI